MENPFRQFFKFIQKARLSPQNLPANEFVERALEKQKHEGLKLAVQSRYVALLVIGALTIYISPRWESIYILFMLCIFALIGWAQLRVGKTGRSVKELLLIFCDLALMTIIMVTPNPLIGSELPAALWFKSGTFIFFFVLLAGGSLAYSWRTLIAMGTWTTVMWMTALVWVVFQEPSLPELSGAINQVTASYPVIKPFLDINDPQIPFRVQEVVIFLIVAITLALAGWRSKQLLLQHAEAERETANLSRYFSPGMVEELSQNDHKLKQTRTQNIAVLFVDIVGFTSMSDKTTPEKTIKLLRQFLNAMENEVFRHNGTLDKYLGDGLMATFGTPFPSDKDASNALACACSMLNKLKDLNREREKNGEPPIKAGFGLHYGEAVLGDIGANRLEFAVIGSTVNAAARLEALTRKLNVPLIASDSLMTKAQTEADIKRLPAPDFSRPPPQKIRGFSKPMEVWTLPG
jgi:adenylate cyclase